MVDAKDAERGGVTGVRIRAWRGRNRQRRQRLLILSLLSMLLACRPPAPPIPLGPPPYQPPPYQPSPPLPPSVGVEKHVPPPVQGPVSTGPLQVRVGLATDLASFDLPCCDSRLTLHLGTAAPRPLDAGLRITPGGKIIEKTVFRLQVAALKNEQQAEGIAAYLAEETGHPADVSFDAGTDLYRVRVGSFERREQAETTKGQLEALGLAQGWIVSQGGKIEDPHLAVQLGGETLRVSGRWLDIAAPTDVGIVFREVRYRGKISIFLNDRGRLNIINELSLENYLRGVVPKEMGPSLYNRLEALKAQTVAARTYTLRNLGEFAQEGYDICSTPRCQVYQGMQVEHPVSDRAIAETAGQVVLVDGQPAETFYSSTCGGHTENVEVVFPLKSGAYLRGVPCVEAGLSQLRGDLAPGIPFATGISHRLLPPTGGQRHKELSARLEHLAFLAKLPIPNSQLKSMQRRDILRHIFTIFDLVLDKRLLLANRSAEWQPREHPLASFLQQERWLPGVGSATEVSSAALAPPSVSEVETLLFNLALELKVLRRQPAHFLSLDSGLLTLRGGAEHQTFDLNQAAVATFRRRGELTTSATLDLAAGDRLDAYWQGDRLVALVQPIEAPPVDLSRHAKRRNWTRYKSLRELRASVQARYPGFPFNDFEVLSRGVSGRVGKLELKGDGGKSLRVEGLAVRWTLDVYDTLFYAQPHLQGNRAVGWTFRGHGWGHGVGMCQAGAYGMAVRGNSYREILDHYYTGIDLARLKPSPQRPRTATTAP